MSLLICLCLESICFGWATSGDGQETTIIVEAEIDRAFATLSSASSAATWSAAREILEGLPPGKAVPALLGRLRTKEVVEDDRTRMLTYVGLSRLGAASTDEGYAQLVEGLADPKIENICVQGLARAPAQRKEQTIRLLLQILVDPQRSDTVKEYVLQALPKLNEAAQDPLPQVSAIFKDRDAPERLRSFASQAMLEIGGLEAATWHCDGLDAVGKKVLMWSLARYIGGATSYGNELSESDVKQLGPTIELVLRAVHSEDADTRQAASQVLSVIEGAGPYVRIRSTDDFEILPEVKTILEEVAASDVDPQIRDRVMKMMDPVYLKRVVKERIRRTERHRNQSKSFTDPDRKE